MILWLHLVAYFGVLRHVFYFLYLANELMCYASIACTGLLISIQYVQSTLMSLFNNNENIHQSHIYPKRVTLVTREEIGSYFRNQTTKKA